ncbi:MAG: hypothetical protein ACRES8_07150, partial [Nevskiaceae bacterium]
MSQASAAGGNRPAYGAALALAAALAAGPASALHEVPEGAAAPTRHISFGGFVESPDSARNVDGGLG